MNQTQEAYIHPVNTSLKVQVRCACNKLLFILDIDLWEAKVIAGKLQIKCPKCGNLQDFR